MGQKRTRSELTPEEIVEHAVQLAERHGMDLRMRDLAEALNTWPNAIYGHFASKPDLQEAMVGSILSAAFDATTVSQALDGSAPWQERFSVIGMRFFRLCAQYTGLGKLLTHEGMGAASGYLHLLAGIVQTVSRQGAPQRETAIALQSAIFYLACIGDLYGYYRNSEPREQSSASLSEELKGTLPDGLFDVLYDYEHEQRAEEGIRVFTNSVEHLMAKTNRDFASDET
ncbi:MAG: helix-turn-helix domain-containing protein [Pseudomonadota bacterium]